MSRGQIILFIALLQALCLPPARAQDAERDAAWAMVIRGLRSEEIREGVVLYAVEDEWDELRPLVEEVLVGTAQAFPGPVARAGAFRVVILSQVEQFAMVSDLGTADVIGAGVRGVTVGDRLFVLSPSSEPSGYDWQRVLAHELLHLLAGRIARTKLPIWFEEGLAWSLDDSWRSGELRRPGVVDMGLLGLAVRNRKLLGWDRLEESFGHGGEPREARLAFTQAALAIRVLVDRGGATSLWSICDRVGEGGDFHEVLAEATGYKSDRFQMRAQTVWSRGASREEMNAARIRFELDVAPEGVAAADRMVLADLLWGRDHPRAALQVLQDIEEEAIRSTAAWALRAGRLLLELGRAEAALDAVERALTIYEDDGQLLLVRALACEKLGRTPEALGAMARVHRLQPFALDVRAHLERLQGGRDERDQ